MVKHLVLKRFVILSLLVLDKFLVIKILTKLFYDKDENVVLLICCIDLEPIWLYSYI